MKKIFFVFGLLVMASVILYSQLKLEAFQTSSNSLKEEIFSFDKHSDFLLMQNSDITSCDVKECGVINRTSCSITCSTPQRAKCSCDCVKRLILGICSEFKESCKCE